MKRKNYIVTTLVFSSSLILAACMPSTTQPDPATKQPAITTNIGESPELPIVETIVNTPQPIATGWKVEVIAQNLEIPWSIVFPSENRLLVSERTGAIQQVIDDVLEPDPVYLFEEVRAKDEAGLMSLALHPEYTENKYIYACYTTSGNGSSIITNVARLIDEGDTLQFDRVIIGNIPAARYHAGCRIQFGPDSMLYISTGDALNTDLPQDITSLAGKILRVTPEGQIPSDNPFSGSPVYSIGHRNPQGLAWDMEKGNMYASEHGPSGFDGPGGGDEINLIISGGNYGWPLGSHDTVPQGTIGPLIQFTPAEAPASLLFYAKNTLPFFKGDLFFGALRGEGLVRVTVAENQTGDIVIESVEKIINNVGRVRDVVSGPNGYIYFTTSSRDGRGTLQDGDDKIFRITPTYD